MTRPNYYHVQNHLMQILIEAGGEMEFKDMYQKLREHYPKLRIAQLAANALQLHWNNHLVWDSPVKPDFENWIRSHENIG